MRLRKKLVPALPRVLAAILPLLPLLLVFPGCTLSAQTAQAATFGLDKGQVPGMEVGLGYIFLHANAPPAQCGCFSLNGGSVTWLINLSHGASIVADISGAHASQVNNTTQSISLVDFLFGGRYTLRKHKFQPFAEGLVGGSNELSSYAYLQNATALAFQGGGGINTTLNRRIAFNLIEADYIHSRLPNAANNAQNDFRLRTGIVFRFGPR